MLNKTISYIVVCSKSEQDLLSISQSLFTTDEVATYLKEFLNIDLHRLDIEMLLKFSSITLSKENSRLTNLSNCNFKIAIKQITHHSPICPKP